MVLEIITTISYSLVALVAIGLGIQYATNVSRNMSINNNSATSKLDK